MPCNGFGSEVRDLRGRASGHLRDEALCAGDGAGGNDGTMEGDSTWVTDTPDGSGSSLHVDGSGDFVRVGDHDSLHLTGELTLMAWVKETAAGAIGGDRRVLPDWLRDQRSCLTR